MRIIVKGKKKIFLLLPTGLLLNGLSAHIMHKFLPDHVPYPFTERQTRALFREIRAYRKRHKDWKLVEVRSADGTFVDIKI